MRFLDAEARPVPAGSSSRPGADRQSHAAQRLDQRKACRIDSGCIVQRSPGGCLHLGMALLLPSKIISCICTKGKVAKILTLKVRLDNLSYLHNNNTRVATKSNKVFMWRPRH